MKVKNEFTYLHFLIKLNKEIFYSGLLKHVFIVQKYIKR